MNYPKPIDCKCGNEISWAATIENMSMKNHPYYVAVCGRCGKRSGVATTAILAAVKWNLMREDELNNRGTA